MITRKESGELFGMLALLGRQGRTASAVTLEESRLGVIGKFTFEKCLSGRPELCAAIFRDLAATIRELTLRLSTVSFDAYGRLRFCLNTFVSDADGAIESSWTQQQLAELAGCRRETVARIISELKRGRWISCDKKRLVVLRPLPESF
jgi:CRP-like cAMP-binding protein